MVRELDISGFVDLQVNGLGGADFSSPDLSEEKAAAACRKLLSSGTEAFLPTVITSPPETYRQTLPLLAGLCDRDEFRGRVLGIHLEGPFISAAPGALGAHPAEWVRPPDAAFLDELLAWGRGTVRMITIAADQPGSAELARHATQRSVMVSLGHHLAGPQDLARLAEAGATCLTHLGNGVPRTLDRHANPIWAGLAEDRLFATVVADGHHLPAALLKTILRAKGVSRIAVTSDASPLAGLPPGPYRLWGEDVLVEADGRLHNPRTGYLAGSSATMLQCMNHLAGLGLLQLDELVHVGFDNPLRILGISPMSLPPPGGPCLLFDEARSEFMLPPGRSGASRRSSP